MQNEEAVSVIVPVYKVEAYLEACLMSIISQDYLETEIILNLTTDHRTAAAPYAICMPQGILT